MTSSTAQRSVPTSNVVPAPRSASTAAPATVDSHGKPLRAGDRVKIVATGLGAYPGHMGKQGTVVGVARLRARIVMDGEEGRDPRRMHPSQLVKARKPRHLAAVPH